MQTELYTKNSQKLVWPLGAMQNGLRDATYSDSRKFREFDAHPYTRLRY
jgi:hypothetical protein